MGNTIINLPDHGSLGKKRIFINMEIRDVSSNEEITNVNSIPQSGKFIRVFYRDLTYDKLNGEVVNVGPIKSYTTQDTEAVYDETQSPPAVITEADPAFTNWDNQLGIPVIRPAIAQTLATK